MMSTILMTEEPPDLGAVGGWYGKPGLPGMGLDMGSGRFRSEFLGWEFRGSAVQQRVFEKSATGCDTTAEPIFISQPR